MFNDEEKKIIERGKELGKTPLEVKQALAKYRQQTGYVAPETKAPTPAAPGALDRAKTAFGNTIQTAGNTVNDAITGQGKFQTDTSNMNLAQQASSAIGRGTAAAGAAAAAVPGSVISAGIAALPDAPRKVLGSIGSGISKAFSSLTNLISNNKELQDWAVAHPDAMRQINDIGNAAVGGGQIASSILAADQAAKGLQAGADKVGNTIDAGINKVQSATQPLVDKVKGYVDSKGGVKATVKDAIAPVKDAEGALGEVLQGKTKDISKGMEAFKAIDTKGVKTYADLKARIDDSIGNLSKQVDDVLAQDQSKTLLDDLATQMPTKSGGTVATNYVDTSLQHLKELYAKTGDAVGEANIDDLINTARTEGLTKLDVNNISRVYNQEFGSKAFSKATGDPLTSVNAQMYENVRSGLKDVARSGMGGTEAEAIDHTISSLYNTKDLVAKNVEAVAKLQQKIADMGLLAKTGHAVTKYADILTGGSIRGMIGGLLPRGAGYKVMNALDLEERLRKNLEIINTAVNAGSKTEVLTAINSLDDVAAAAPAASLDPALAEKALKYAEQTIASHEKSAASMGSDFIKSAGGMESVTQNSLKHIVDGMSREFLTDGVKTATYMPDAAKLLAPLKAQSFSSFDELMNAVNAALSIK